MPMPSAQLAAFTAAMSTHNCVVIAWCSHEADGGRGTVLWYTVATASAATPTAIRGITRHPIRATTYPTTVPTTSAGYADRSSTLPA
jgi:hypothetical protein